VNKADLDVLTKAARQAGKIARKFFQAGNAKTWDKEAGHPVTEADIAVNDDLRTNLQQARPDYGWLSEETKDDRSHQCAPRSFVVDPIDGTRAFINGLPHFTICLAVIEKGRPVCGVVYNPISQDMFTAVLGGGAFLNGVAVTASDCQNIAGCKMIGYGRKFKHLGWPDMQLSMRNSVALRIVRVAAGICDAAIAFGQKSDWDLAAASLIAQEAGAKISDIDGKGFSFGGESTKKNGVICAGPNLYPLLLHKLISGSDNVEPKILETKMSDRQEQTSPPKQLLHLVIGGELVDPMKTEFIDLGNVIYIGAYPDYATAYDAWKNAAQSTVDNAHMRFFILHAHHLIDPDNDGIIG